MRNDDATIKPTLETLLERLDDIRRENQEFRKSMETRLDDFGQRLDNIEKQFSLSRVDVLDVKMELRELRNQLKEHLPALK